ncbi:uncharacterized protein LOC124406552 [Diprion similis]|uniref:uncharacterized protein LOC124406552 n=1 Tax=Diprion similis TaxID=362088 RepID=UPI001EF8064A|nr:uncharacterized protein LOC124406552 [Diprion similis]
MGIYIFLDISHQETSAKYVHPSTLSRKDKTSYRHPNVTQGEAAKSKTDSRFIYQRTGWGIQGKITDNECRAANYKRLHFRFIIAIVNNFALGRKKLVLLIPALSTTTIEMVFNSTKTNSSSNGDSANDEVNADLVFEAALLNYGSRKCFMLGLFLLCTSPGILNGFHVMVYVFYGYTPQHWCAIPVLEKAGWTPEQIRNISSPKPGDWSNCKYYKRNYAAFEKMTYQEAMKNVESQTRRQILIDCTEFSYDLKDLQGTSVVPEVR